MTDVNKIISEAGVCPILVRAERDASVPTARALVEGGLPALEILMRDEEAFGHLERIADAVPEITVGAGTVLTVERAKRAIDAGAKFVVMPGFSHKVVEYCLSRGIQVIPGCVTATEILTALEYGVTTVKFFPVYELGGAAMLNQLSGPFPQVKFVVTGALDSVNFLPLLKCGSVAAAGGDWMFTDYGALVKKDYRQITENIRDSLINAKAIRDGAK